MILVNAKITVKAGERDNAISKMQDLIKSTRLEPGCINYNLYINAEDENVLMVLEQWENQDVLDAHMRTEHFKAFNAAVADILAEEVDIAVYSADKI